MNIPNLPTDSLYKFLALAGLSFILISTYMTYNILSNKNQETLKFNGEISIYNYENDKLNSDLKFIKQRLRKLCALCNCNCFDKKGEIQILPNFTKSDNKELNNQRQEIDSLLNGYHDKLDQFNIKTLQIQSKNELLADNEESTHAYMKIFLSLIATGFLMAVMGFRLWYKRIQIYQDKILRDEALKLNENKINEQAQKAMD